MTRLTRPLAALVLAALCASVARAQDPAAGAELYTVEMIVFAYPDDGGAQAETWPALAGLPDTSRALPVSDAAGGVSAVSPEAYRLSGAWQALKSSRRYRPLRHLAWEQAGVASQRAPEVLVGGDEGSPVYGAVQVSRARYLHLKVDLVYEHEGERYRLAARRRMRSNELHFVDHPLFGVLILVTPVTP